MRDERSHRSDVGFATSNSEIRRHWLQEMIRTYVYQVATGTEQPPSTILSGELSRKIWLSQSHCSCSHARQAMSQRKTPITVLTWRRSPAACTSFRQQKAALVEIHISIKLCPCGLAGVIPMITTLPATGTWESFFAAAATARRRLSLATATPRRQPLCWIKAFSKAWSLNKPNSAAIGPMRCSQSKLPKRPGATRTYGDQQWNFYWKMI